MKKLLSVVLISFFAAMNAQFPNSGFGPGGGCYDSFSRGHSFGECVSNCKAADCELIPGLCKARCQI